MYQFRIGLRLQVFTASFNDIYMRGLSFYSYLESTCMSVSFNSHATF